MNARQMIMEEIEKAEKSVSLYRSLGMDANAINTFVSYIKGLQKALELMKETGL